MTKQYKKPEDMIDYNKELDTINGLMSIFYAYNQQNQDEEKRWTVWPEWELCLTSIDASLHFEDEKKAVKSKLRDSIGFHSLKLFTIMNPSLMMDIRLQ